MKRSCITAQSRFMRDEIDRAQAATDKAWREAGYE
jgi:hypothetical protein